MNAQELRFECLKLAHGSGSGPAAPPTTEIVDRARAYAEFVLDFVPDKPKTDPVDDAWVPPAVR